jgi:hypothetical protein
VDFTLARETGRLTVTAATTGGPAPALTIAPAFPRDARVRSVTVDGREAHVRVDPDGDVQRARVDVPAGAGPRRVVFIYDDGTDVFARVEPPARGATSEGLRILRARAEASSLHLTLEGLAGRTYRLGVRTPRHVGGAAGVTVTPAPRGAELAVSFDGNGDAYVTRRIDLPLR